MANRNKGPRILGIYKPRYGDVDDLRVIITTKQFNRLPEWVRDQINWHYTDDEHHREVVIKAKDELEAMMRFKKLWAALPTMGE